MDLYIGWCDLKPGVKDLAFVEAFETYMGRLKAEGRIAGYRLMRRKLGLGPKDLGEFQFQIEVTGLGQLDEAFQAAAARREPIESDHFGVNSLVTNLTFALYRDFPDPVRETGEERF